MLTFFGRHDLRKTETNRRKIDGTYRGYLIVPSPLAPLVDRGTPGGGGRKIVLRGVLVCEGWIRLVSLSE